MKNFIIISVIALFICNCNDSGSSSHGTKGLKFNPDTLTDDDKYNLPSTVNTISFGGADVTVNYSIIYEGTVNSIAYVGIAMSNTDQTFNLKLYYNGTSVPASGSIIDSDDSLTIKVKNGSGTYVSQSSSLTFTSVSDPQTTTVNEKTYTTYTMTISGTATLNSSSGPGVLTFPNPITVRLAGGD
ncbi:MAG: hypothetical protein MUC95_02360 [Spirochaetes bacterium]|nr:hypothetical protein [Spirochaetota bacterium]